MSEAPPYRVRQSARAKHVSIRVSHWGEVEIVVPPGFDPCRVPALVQRRQDWIDRMIERMQTERLAAPSESATGLLPDRLELRALQQTWTVSYSASDQPRVQAAATAPQQLALSGAIEPAAARRVLLRWLRDRARLQLTPWLRQVSRDIELPFEQAAIRQQKTRWASCSSCKTISLNVKLLFLPPPIVRYVFIHELCHTQHLNHSAQFWALVAAKDPDYRLRDRELRQGWRYVPQWVDCAAPPPASP